MTAALILFDLAVVWAGSLLVPPFGRCCRALLVSRALPTGKHRPPDGGYVQLPWEASLAAL